MDPVSRVVARRIARVVFGSALIAGMCALAVLAPAFGHGCGCGYEELHPPIHAAQVIGAMWIVAIGGAAFVWSLARRVRFRNPQALQRAGLAVPAAGLALALPLTLHLPVIALDQHFDKSFDEWVLLSLVITGIPHIVFASALLQRGCDLGTTGITKMTAKRVFIWVTIAACIPWIAAFGIPPVLVMLTLLPCMIPVSYMETLARRERGWLDAAGLPPAIALR
ncbi:MAG TPA: hypothetical protein VGM88_30395 [Kofleriaceae bacterium]|jgi:hypothetical protein